MDLVGEPLVSVRSQVPEARLPFAVSTQQVAGFAEAAVEAQVVANGVLPTIRSRLKEGEVLSGAGQETKGSARYGPTTTSQHNRLYLKGRRWRRSLAVL